jgi:hypothetical protein
VLLLQVSPLGVRFSNIKQIGFQFFALNVFILNRFSFTISSRQ